jgi:hypothetical protein
MKPNQIFPNFCEKRFQILSGFTARPIPSAVFSDPLFMQPIERINQSIRSTNQNDFFFFFTAARLKEQRRLPLDEIQL